MNFSLPGMPSGFDPSKMSPQAIAEITALMQTLPPAQIMKMQSLMHNAMAGFDVTKDFMEFERSLPPGFKEKLARVMYLANGVDLGENKANEVVVEAAGEKPTDLQEARLVILRAVAAGTLSPEEAAQHLFPQGSVPK